MQASKYVWGGWECGDIERKYTKYLEQRTKDAKALRKMGTEFVECRSKENEQTSVFGSIR